MHPSLEVARVAAVEGREFLLVLQGTRSTKVDGWARFDLARWHPKAATSIEFKWFMDSGINICIALVARFGNHNRYLAHSR